MTYINMRGKLIKITYYGAQRKMARGDHVRAASHFKLVREGKRS